MCVGGGGASSRRWRSDTGRGNKGCEQLREQLASKSAQ